MKNTFLYVIIILIYFLVTNLFPWNKYLKHTTISSSYIFDFLYPIFLILVLRLKQNLFTIKKIKRLMVTVGLSFSFGFFCLFLANFLEIVVPLTHVKHLFLQLFILAPLSEELLYRGVFFNLGERSTLSGKFNIILNSFLYGFSYLVALWYLPTQFHSFIYLQVIYSFFLGFLCCIEYQYQKNLLSPISIRIAFSSALYLGVVLKLI